MSSFRIDLPGKGTATPTGAGGSISISTGRVIQVSVSQPSYDCRHHPGRSAVAHSEVQKPATCQCRQFSSSASFGCCRGRPAGGRRFLADWVIWPLQNKVKVTGDGDRALLADLEQALCARRELLEKARGNTDLGRSPGGAGLANCQRG